MSEKKNIVWWLEIIRAVIAALIGGLGGGAAISMF